MFDPREELEVVMFVASIQYVYGLIPRLGRECVVYFGTGQI